MHRMLTSLAATLALTLAISFPASVRAEDAAATAHVLGNPEAPITIIEYASLTCPHCAEFDKTVLPQIKTAYIDTGKAKLVYRDFPLDGVALKASMIARCLPSDRYFAFVDTLFKQQSSWAYGGDPKVGLQRMARLAGMGQDTFDKCFDDKSIEDAVLKERLDGSKQFDIQGTPTLIVNGKVSDGNSFEDLDKMIKPLAAKS
ncbi:MAG: DsbA family protein [Alphaproteobacteria bacterium]|nr:DsbA family protein [Alphaproteobacteria bacterium]